MKREDLRVHVRHPKCGHECAGHHEPVTDADLAALLPEIIESVGQAAVVDYLADNGDGTWSIKNWVTKRGLAVADAAYGSVIEIPSERLAALGYVRADSIDEEWLGRIIFEAWWEHRGHYLKVARQVLAALDGEET